MRNYYVLRLFCETGIRKSEMGGITLSDIAFNNCGIRTIGKGDKQKFCYLTNSIQIALKRYLQARRQRKSKNTARSGCQWATNTTTSRLAQMELVACYKR